MFRNAALNGLLMLACAAIAAALAGCSEEGPTKPKVPVLCVSETGWFAFGWGGSGPLVSVTSCGGGGAFDWTAEGQSDWVSLSRSSGPTPGSFRIIAAANKTLNTRSDTVYVRAAGVIGSPKTVIVTQAPGAPTLSVSTQEWEVSPEGATSALIDVTNCGTDASLGWSTTESLDWLTISQSSGTTPGSFSIAVPPNFSGADHSGTITVTAAGAEGSPKTIRVTQPFSLLAARRDYEVGYGPVSMCTADFDGDGDKDLAVVNYLTDDMCILKNNGDGTFGAPLFYPIGRRPFSIVCADLDGDGSSDLAIIYAESNEVAIMKNRGDGTFMVATNYAVVNEPLDLAAADLDGDGDSDLAIAGWSGLSILMNNGDGTFAAPVQAWWGGNLTSLCCVDLNGDGYKDIAASTAMLSSDYVYEIVVLMNRGDGTFEDRSPSFGSSWPRGICIASSDFDGDGDNDLALVDATSTRVRIFLNEGDGAFGLEPNKEAVTVKAAEWWITSIFPADLDGDGTVDLAVASQGEVDNVSIVRNSAGRGFSEPLYFTAGLSPRSIVCADFDGDGDIDVAVPNSESGSGVYTISVFKNFTRGPAGLR